MKLIPTRGAVLALLIKLDSPGPVFFFQERVGRDGRRFKMVKFRSMKTDAEQQLATLKAQNEGAGLLFKMKDDPHLSHEVDAFSSDMRMRMEVRPGITGLWQVSGRSDLSWDESVRLDLRYVENWSVMNDLQIMWRTAKVMVQPSGAY